MASLKDGVLCFLCLLYVSTLSESRPPQATWNFGISNHLVTFIVNGNAVPKGRWPWQLSLERWNGLTWYHTCGATLIGTRHVLTAAHCTYGAGASEFRVLLGAANRLIRDEEDVITIEKIIEHPEFDPVGDGVPNDLCILILSREARLNEYVQIGDLPREGEDFTGADCWISGWGKLSGSAQTTSLQLQEVKMPCISNRECDVRMSNVIGGDIDDWHICVFDPRAGSGSCQGDSGGPMHCRTSSLGPWKVAGVTSWGVEGCPGNFPSVYTRTSYYRSWIDDVMANE